MQNMRMIVAFGIYFLPKKSSIGTKPSHLKAYSNNYAAIFSNSYNADICIESMS